MLNCQVTFYKDDPLSLRVQNPNSSTEPPSVNCFIFLKEHQVNFHIDQDTYEPFYKLSPPSITTKIDSTTSTLAVTSAKKPISILKITSTKSTISAIEDFCKENSNETKLYHPLYYTPSNQARVSFLSQDHKASKFRGLMNLGLVIAIFARLRDLLTNLSTYGIRPPQTVTVPTGDQVLFGPLCVLFTSVLIYVIEKLAYKKILPNLLANLLEALNMVIAVALPVYFVLVFKPNPLFALAYLAWTAMMILKQISYVVVMHEVRKVLPQVASQSTLKDKSSKEKEQEECYVSRENLEVLTKKAKNPSELVSITNILYFYFAPTLNYQLWYPRTAGIRWGYVASMFVQLILSWSFFLFWANQFVIPLMNDSGKIFKHGSLTQKLENVIDVGNAYSLLLPSFFYGLFHLLTNFIAELLRFADRDFYKDFWNCRSLGQFWVNWNLPVHKWCKRHIYYPVLSHGYSRELAIGAVFLFSGVAHEYIFGLPLRLFGSYSILMMVLQAPIILIERKVDTFLRNSQVGNFLFWVFMWFLMTPYGLCHYYANYLINNGWVE